MISFNTSQLVQTLERQTLKFPVQQVKNAGYQAVRTAWQYRYWAIGGAGVVMASAAAVVAAFMFVIPQTINYQFAATEHCVFSPAVLAEAPAAPAGAPFTLSRRSLLSIGKRQLLSSGLCVTPQASPSASATYNSRIQANLAGVRVSKRLTVRTSAFPALSSNTFTTEAVPTDTAQVFTLNSADATFTYQLSANGKTAPCTKQGSEQSARLNCPMAPLQLGYATTYPVDLQRVFGGQPAGTVASGQVATISATTIVQTSIANGATVYDKPQVITLQTDKPLTAVEQVVLQTKNADGSTTVIPTTTQFAGSTITVTAATELPRRSTLELAVANLTATDHSRLAGPYKLSFTTSGGPKVNGINLAKTGVTAGQAIVVSFDQALLANQAPQQFVTFTANGAAQAATMSLSGNKLTITPQGSYPVCARLALSVNASVQSAYGISGDSAWSYSARARCYTSYSIGTSVQGRAIIAYQFGSSSSMILYVGGTHGAEQNSSVILQKWVAELDASPDSLPANHSIVVIPAVNPDGLAIANRLNANGIDLNRNFPANNWQTNVTLPGGGGVVTTAGGAQALSEPESAALASFVTARQPRLVLTYHSHAGVVEANEAGDSVSLAATYVAKAQYRAIPTSAIGTTFDYSTTGAFEDWLQDKRSTPAFVIELYSATADEFSRNRTAMWAMAQLP